MARKTIKLEEFKGFKSNVDLKDIFKESAEEATEELRSYTWKSGRGAKGYSSTWIYEYDKLQREEYVRIYNKKNWQLTWLLENGHLIVNKRGGVGWAAPRKHIEPTYDKQVKKIINEIENLDDLIDFE